MIAEELFALMREGGYIEEEWLDRKQAADYLGVSESWMEKNDKCLPRTKLGGTYKYPKSGLNAWMRR